ncbi:uncharacterized protein FA14DRAFT_169624 [Meira miltonrushii]|uniref:Citrate transporter-like domain-containing protein n=1 Tax=Meira miltonrushii TaxID=1280837 RepID=A0A316VGL9_9BASI|nr:uncharacterized protein FA14DRAFT_169624 [Meira miltonrushii]PWN36650.1 hypothetical protein FA14DRAFT_169624 [Meira miltonrushii]
MIIAMMEWLRRSGSGSSIDATKDSLDGHGIFAIIVFAIVALICIQPVHVPIPHFIAKRARSVRTKLFGAYDHNGQREEEDVQPPEATAAQPEGQSPSEVSQIKSDKRSYLVFNHVWTPAIGILFLLATKTIGGEQIKLGIIGEEGVEPYDVLIFFISLAYIAISLDATGLLRYLAFQVCIKAGSNGMGLYFILYAFFWTLGVLVGNDPVILSGTAFLVYLTRVAGISPPSAWIWAQFVAANVSSAVLVSSNPTNLVIASGFNISFPIYTAYMVLPALVSALAALGAMLLFFRNEPPTSAEKKGKDFSSGGVTGWAKSVFTGQTGSKGRRRNRSKPPISPTKNGNDIAMQDLSNDSQNSNSHDQDDETKDSHRTPIIYIPKTIVRPDVDPKAALVDPKGAIFASCIMAATLITVIVTNVTGGAKVYMVAAPGAAICLTRDIVYDWYTWRSFRKEEQAKERDVVETQNGNANGDAPALSVNGGEHTAEESTNAATESRRASVEKVATSEEKPPKSESSKEDTSKSKPVFHRLIAFHEHCMEIFPTVTYVAARLPFPLLPFAFGMFILVQSLGHVGFINILAGGLGNVCGHGYIGCSFFISLLGVILCNLGGTNIGATILLTRALQSTYFQQKLPAQEAELILRAAAYSVAFGSNVGALGVIIPATVAGVAILLPEKAKLTLSSRFFTTIFTALIIKRAMSNSSSEASSIQMVGSFTDSTVIPVNPKRSKHIDFIIICENRATGNTVSDMFDACSSHGEAQKEELELKEMDLDVVHKFLKIISGVVEQGIWTIEAYPIINVSQSADLIDLGHKYRANNVVYVGLQKFHRAFVEEALGDSKKFHSRYGSAAIIKFISLWYRMVKSDLLWTAETAQAYFWCMEMTWSSWCKLCNTTPEKATMSEFIDHDSGKYFSGEDTCVATIYIDKLRAGRKNKDLQRLLQELDEEKSERTKKA